ncbi:hypothetical protein ACHAPJ_001584 [Fusarium lateritium]
MKGRDRRVCVAMHDACFSAGFYLMLANLTHHESQAGEEDDTLLDDVYGPHGKRLTCFQDVIHLEEIMGPNITIDYPDSEEEDDNFYPEDCMPPWLLYRRTVVLIVPKIRVKEHISTNSGWAPPYSVSDDRNDQLAEMVCEDLSRAQDDDYTIQVATEFMTAVVNSGMAMQPMTVGCISRWALELGNTDLIQTCLRTCCNLTPECQLRLGELLNEYLVTNYQEKSKTIDWDHW